MRLIDADALENDIRKVLSKHHRKRTVLALYMMLDIIRGRDTIKFSPVIHSKWTNIGGKKYPVYSCSECNGECSVKTPYCAYCGAEMDGGE